MSKIDQPNQESEVRARVRVSQNWIQRLWDQKEIILPLGEQYHLHRFQFQLLQDQLMLSAEVQESPGSVLTIQAQPRWEVSAQSLHLDDLDVKTQSKNLLIKSAGWLASTFLQEKIDRRIESQVNELYKTYLEKIIAGPLDIPLSDQGLLNTHVNSLHIGQMSFMAGAVEVDVVIKGVLMVTLDPQGDPM